MRLSRGEWLLLGLLAAWSLIPLAVAVAHLIRHGDVLSGTDGIGVIDHFGYLSWIRDAGEHGLIANRFDLADSDGVYLQPMWLVSGLAVRAGLPIQAGLLLWKPVCVLVLFGGVLAYARRTLEGRWEQLAAAAVALLYVPPAMALMGRTGIGDEFDDGVVNLFAFQVAPTTYLWGYVQTAIAVGLMPVFLLALERLLKDGGRRPLAVAAGTGLLVSWVHPWQGMVLLGIAFAIWLWCGPRRTAARLAVPVLATLAPLVYFAVLAQIDPIWGEGSENAATPHYWFLLLVAMAPLAAFAVAGAVRGRPLGELDLRDRLLLLWPVVTLLVYAFLDRTFYFNVLSGLTIPLAVLAVRGARGLPAWAAVAAVVLATAPGLANVAYEFRQGTGADGSPRYVVHGDADALEFVRDAPGDGGVLTRLYLGQAVPAFTGRNTYVGHPVWTPHIGERVDATERLFAGRLPRDEARAFVRSTGARFVIQDCAAGRDLGPVLGPLVQRRHRFGCATVYEVE